LKVPDFDNSDIAIAGMTVIAVFMIVYGQLNETILAAIIGAIAGIAHGRKK